MHFLLCMAVVLMILISARLNCKKLISEAFLTPSAGARARARARVGASARASASARARVSAGAGAGASARARASATVLRCHGANQTEWAARSATHTMAGTAPTVPRSRRRASRCRRCAEVACRQFQFRARTPTWRRRSRWPPTPSAPASAWWRRRRCASRRTRWWWPSTRVTRRSPWGRTTHPTHSVRPAVGVGSKYS